MREEPYFITSPERQKKDIISLTEYFINEFNELFNKNVKGISSDAMNLLMRYSWPGNVRELRNIIERIMIIDNPEIIECEHIPVEIASCRDNLSETSDLSQVLSFEIPDEGIDIKELTSSFQAMLVRKALQKSGGKKEKATNLSKMILIKQYAKEKWEQYWKEKLGIKGYFNIQIQTVEINLCPTF